MAIVENRSSEIGDILRITTEVPIIGVVSLLAFSDSTDGETAARFFEKKFRYSVDGGANFSDWLDLTSINIQSINISRKDLFVLEYRYTRDGVDAGGELAWNNTVIDGEVLPLQYPHYSRSIFAEFFDVNDPSVLGWAINVLEKLYKTGHTPAYVTRSYDEIMPITQDRDFLSFFGSITHFFAIIVHYARLFGDINQSARLQRLYAISRGVIPPYDDDQEQLYYLLRNYVSEYQKRGTSEIVRKSTGQGDVDGEFLRLINYQTIDEFVFGLIENRFIGWCIGNSSPMWSSTKGMKNLVKAYEPSSEVKDLSKYPLLEPSYVSLSNGKMLISGHQDTGLQVGVGMGTVDIEKLVTIDSSLCYEVSFKIRKLSAAPISLSFDMKGYILGGPQLSFFDADSLISTNSFLVAPIDLNLSNVDYSFRATIEPYNTSANTSKPMFEGGRLLKFAQNHKYIVPQITVLGDSGCADVEIFDIKISPAKINFTQGQLGAKNIIFALIKNNGGESLGEVERISSQYLIPYKNYIKIQQING